jgi:hypothetical protein
MTASAGGISGLALAILGGIAVLVILAGLALALWDTRRP